MKLSALVDGEEDFEDLYTFTNLDLVNGWNYFDLPEDKLSTFYKKIKFS